MCLNIDFSSSPSRLNSLQASVNSSIMFTDRQSQVVTCRSEMTIERSKDATSGTQTGPSNRSQTDTQTTEKKTVETQTLFKQNQQPQVDYEKLALFLNKVTPSIIQALDESSATNAFDDYVPPTAGRTTEKLQLTKKIQTSRVEKISGVTWSSGGGTLAVSHSYPSHPTWCDHITKLQFYRISSKREFINTPDKIFEINSCVTCLSYHPTEPSLLAAGLYNGDVFLWNLQKDDAITPTAVHTHDDSVTQITWHLNRLVSSSGDGFILVHRIEPPSVVNKFKIFKEYNPSERTRPTSGSRDRAVEAGLCVTGLDFSRQDPSIFIVGTLCGGIYKCTTNGTDLDPVLDEYQRHEGSVTCVKCCPFKSLFVTTGTDKQIYIFDFDQVLSRFTVSLQDPAVGLEWTIENPNVFIAYGAGPSINGFDVDDGKPLDDCHFDREDRENTSSLCVNSKRDFVAIGDTRGVLEIWKIVKSMNK